MFSFACIEQPMQTFISSVVNGKRVGANEKGTVFSTENRNDQESWTVTPIVSSPPAIFTIRNAANGYFLTSTKKGFVSTTSKPCESTEWSIQASSSAGQARYVICSVAHGKSLACNEEGDLYTSSDGNDSWCEWNIEVRTGELCFLTSAKFWDKQIKCEPSGHLSMTCNKKGWEVWRFASAPGCTDGKVVLISSWTHHHKFLCSDPQGKVFTTENPLGDWERWNVEKDPNSAKEGIIIKSKDHGRVLHTDGHRVFTVEHSEHGGTDCLWRTDSACSQTYFLSAVCHDKQVCAQPEGRGPITTGNRKEWEKWKIEKPKVGGLYYTIRSQHGTYLGCSLDGSVLLTHAVLGDWGLWQLESSPHGGFFLISKACDQLLACDEKGNLYTVKDQRGGWETWRLEPCMPGTISGHQMKVHAIIGSSVVLALGLTIAMPFAVMGVIGGLGFAPGGIVGGSVAAGMMSAEAIAAGGGVVAGGTVAMLQSIGAVGLGAAGTSAAVAGGAALGAGLVATAVASTGAGSSQDISRRSGIASTVTCKPFCEWKSW